MPPPQATEQLLDPQLIARLLASKYYMLASVVILYLDYLLTFDLELENLWRKKFIGPTLLIFLNRYYPLLVYAIVLIAVHDPSWSGENQCVIIRCENFKRFPLLSALASEAVIGIIVILRLYALYARGVFILYALVPLYVLQLMLGGWASDAVVQASGLPPRSGCIVTVPHTLAYRFAWLWGSAALFDTLVFGLTMFKTLSLRHSGLKLPLTTLFLRDGLVYFAVMFSAKLLNFVLFWTTLTADLVTLNWTFNNIITVIMINRLVLNLRQEASRSTIVSASGKLVAYTESSTLMETLVAGLGESVSTEEDMDEKVDYDDAEESPVNNPLGLRWDPYTELEAGRR